MTTTGSEIINPNNNNRIMALRASSGIMGPDCKFRNFSLKIKYTEKAGTLV